MKKNETYYTELISRYFFGEATPTEIDELETWVKAGKDNEALFLSYSKTWRTLENERISSTVNLDKEWNRLSAKLPGISSVDIPKPLLHPVKSKSDNQKSKIIYLALRIAAVFILLAIPSFLLYRYLQSPAEKQLSALTEMVEQTLPDGTVVTLNAGATLSYPARFEGSARHVTLKGEAWFEVSHNRSKPFIIAAENARIRVVGTTFFVNSMTNRNTREVILSSGMVKVYYDNKPGEPIILLPGEKAELNSQGNGIRKTRNEDVNYLAWKTRHIVFNGTPLNEVAALLAQVYHTNIRLSGNGLGDCRITATFDRQSLESVLNVLKATLDLQVRNTGGEITLSGHGCTPIH